MMIGIDGRLHTVEEVEKMVQERNELTRALEALYRAAPSIGHPELPTYECPALDLARAMNEAARVLGRDQPYPKAVKVGG